MLTYFKNVLLLPIVCIDVEIELNKLNWIEICGSMLRGLNSWPEYLQVSEIL